MLRPIFTLDYEIHGNGDGCPRRLMIEPTYRMMRLFEAYGARLTIMADIGEILAFKGYAHVTGVDKFDSAAIECQLRDAIHRGHDVQLHIHSSFFRAKYDGKRWLQDWAEYDFANLSPERMDSMIAVGKAYLESLLRPIDSSYRCHVFRAANWSMSPSRNAVETLTRHGITIDTSVFKHGSRNHLVHFDYRDAQSALVPWRADPDDICHADDEGMLWEFPIYSELRPLPSFLTVQRLGSAIAGRLRWRSTRRPSTATTKSAGQAGPRGLAMLLARHAWKADFNQCSGRQLIAAIDRARRQHADADRSLPFVLIGHSKLFSQLNEWSLRPFLAYVAEHSTKFSFGVFADFNNQTGGANPA